MGTVGTRDQQRTAFDEMVLKHLDELFGTGLRLTRSRSDAEDLVQEAVMRAWAFWERFQPGTNSRAWMHRILMNTFINGYRKKRRERELLQAARQEMPASTSTRDERRITGEHVSDEVEAALRSLPEDFRTVVLMVDLSDLSYKEVAESLECPIGTVMSRLHRGRRLLQRRLHSFALRHGYVAEAA